MGAPINRDSETRAVESGHIAATNQGCAVVSSGQEAKRPGDATNVPGRDTEEVTSMPDKLTALPAKGQRVRVTRFTNDAMQTLPPFEGVVEGIEFRLTPPIVSVVERTASGGRRHDIQNFGNGSTWEPV